MPMIYNSLGKFVQRLDAIQAITECRAVKLDTAAGNGYVDPPAAGDDGVVGILAVGQTRSIVQQAAGKDMVSVERLIYGSVVWWEAGDAISIGDDLETDSSGRGVTIADSATDEWSFRIAIALEAAAAAGVKIAVFMAPGYILK